MRSASIATNLRCNQACTYCQSRAPRDDLARIQPARLLAEADTALAAGATEIVLTGGEPTLRGDLPSLVRSLRERGADVVLETNATLLDLAAAMALREAGVTLARVNLAGSSDALDAVTRDPGGFARTLAGLRALRDAGLPTELRTTLVRETLPLVRDLPERLVALGLAPPAVTLLRAAVATAAPDASSLLRFEEAVPALLELEVSGRRAGIPVRLAPEPGPPPCVFPHAGRAAHLFSLTPGGRDAGDGVRVPACADCRVADRCPGFPKAYVARFPIPAHVPVADDRVRRRLSLISSVAQQVDRELVQVNLARNPKTGATLEEHLVRVVFHCNQACSFCFVSTHLPAAADERVLAAIDAALARRAKVVLTGGEPTLHPRLAELVRRAAQGEHAVQIQTNATRLGEPGSVHALRDAGLAEAFVSLHGATAETSDLVTDAPGTYEKTLRGIDALVGGGIDVTLNFVVCAPNATELPDAVARMAARWPGIALSISYVAPSSDLVPRDRALVPRHSEVIPIVARALADAARLGVRIVGQSSMCGLPLCLVPVDVRDDPSLRDIQPGEDGGEFQKTEECARCALSSRCFGLRRGYVELWGSSELRAVT